MKSRHNPAPPSVAGIDVFTCAKCGEVFRFPGSGENWRDADHARPRLFVGGRPWCAGCAEERFRRQTRWRERANERQIDYASPYFRPV